MYDDDDDTEDTREVAREAIARAREALARHRPDPDATRTWRQPELGSKPEPLIPAAAEARVRADALRAGAAYEASRDWRAALARREADKAVKRYGDAAEQAVARFVVETMRAERNVLAMRHAEAERRLAELAAALARLARIEGRAEAPPLRVVGR